MSGRKSIFMSAVKQTLATSNGYQIATSVCNIKSEFPFQKKRLKEVLSNKECLYFITLFWRAGSIWKWSEVAGMYHGELFLSSLTHSKTPKHLTSKNLYVTAIKYTQAFHQSVWMRERQVITWCSWWKFDNLREVVHKKFTC